MPGHFKYIRSVFEYMDHMPLNDESGDVEKETFFGEVWVGREVYAIKCIEGKPEIFFELHTSGLLYIDRILDNALYFKHTPALYGIPGDIEKIAEIYKRLIRMGIFIMFCVFVRSGDEIKIACPDELVKYTDTDKSKIVNKLYMEDNSGSMYHSMPQGIDYYVVRSLIWETGVEEISELIGDKLTINSDVEMRE